MIGNEFRVGSRASTIDALAKKCPMGSGWFFIDLVLDPIGGGFFGEGSGEGSDFRGGGAESGGVEEAGNGGVVAEKGERTK